MTNNNYLYIFKLQIQSFLRLFLVFIYQGVAQIKNYLYFCHIQTKKSNNPIINIDNL